MSQLHAYSPDVLVCGSGCAGIGAALAAAQVPAPCWSNAGFAGGIMTTVGLPFFDGLASKGDNRIVNKGIAFELAVQMGICAPTATHLEQHNPTFDNVERYKRLLDRLIAAESDTLQSPVPFCSGRGRPEGRFDRCRPAGEQGRPGARAARS